MRQQRLEPRKVALLNRCEERGRQLVALLARGKETRPSLRDVLARPAGDLTDVGHALAEDRRDLVIAVIEDVAQQQDSALLR